MDHPPLQCPACCAGRLAAEDARLVCADCGRVLPMSAGGAVLEARLAPGEAGVEGAPAPLAPGDLDGALAELDGGEPWRPVLERLLLRLPDERAERLMQLLRESSGAYAVCLRARGGAALLVGNALSGAAVALARLGFAVTEVDVSPERLHLAAHRDHALTEAGATRSVRVGPGDRLPFADGAFDVVLREAEDRGGRIASIDECRRVARGELVVIGDNRLGYKDSSGKRGDFRVVGPAAWVRRVLLGGGRTLAGWRRALRPAAGDATHGYALYPHSRDFTHVEALDEPGPRLYVGPKERGNRLKLVAYRAGLFSLLTPSFAVVLARGGRAAPSERRLDRLLAHLGEELGEGRPRADALLSTRGNSALVLTAGGPEESGSERGRLVVRIPLSPAQERLVGREHEMSLRLRRELPELPVPEPLFRGRIEGVFLTCERRLPGHSAAQWSGRVEAMQRLYRDAARHLALLVVERAPLDAERFARLVTERFELAAARAEPESCRRALERMHAEARERLLGVELPFVLRHSDLRSKHVQIEESGRVLGYYDWGTAEEADLPLFDLLHLIVHERKQEAGSDAGTAWELARRGGAGLRPGERAALSDHARRVGLADDARDALVELYPLLLGAMAERNWDYSRPRWLHRGFGL